MATTENGRPASGYTYDSFTGNGPEAKKPTESHFLWWCAGAYQALLKDCPSEQTKYAGLGGVLLVQVTGIGARRQKKRRDRDRRGGQHH